MLHVEQPHAHGGGQQHDRQVHQHEGDGADQPDQQADDDRHRRVGRLRADPRCPAGAHEADRQPVLQDEHIGRSDAEHHRRMAVKTITKTAPARQREIFAHGQRVDVAHAAVIEVAGGRVVKGMRAPPEIVRRQGEHADGAADPVVGEAVAEESTVPAIVLDHEQTHQKAGGRDRQQQRKPPESVAVRQPHQRPKRDQRTDRDDELDDAARAARFTVAQQLLRPRARLANPSRPGRVTFGDQDDILCGLDTGVEPSLPGDRKPRFMIYGNANALLPYTLHGFCYVRYRTHWRAG